VSKATTIRDRVVQFRQDVRERIRSRIREAIETVLEEELTEALGSHPNERSERRCAYRNSARERLVTIEAGTRVLRVPRARILEQDGSSREFRSEVLPRYARRSRVVDELILGAYLAGVNSRRIRKVLEPLLGERHLSKSAVSRVVARLRALFDLFLDGFHLKVRLARRVVAVPVLAVLGVAEDGHPGLSKALEGWPGVRVQRCTRHKLVNLEEHCPVHARAEMKRDYHRIINARDGLAARNAYDAFVAKWGVLCPAVARSLQEAGGELLTFYEFPKTMWRALRSRCCTGWWRSGRSR
jgi:transposase-like protein